MKNLINTSSASNVKTWYDPSEVTILKRKEVCQRLNLSLNAIELRIKSGVLPPPINLGGRSVGFIKPEIDIILSCMIGGKEAEEIKLIASELINFRSFAVKNLALS
jgi:prophage regulatory protein